ncbi:hypothetical protein TNCV_3959531 [Trichonephila clavipes]|nr:hypothetical protein TNCV_3959531 [Trichonephila clavipes]
MPAMIQYLDHWTTTALFIRENAVLGRITFLEFRIQVVEEHFHKYEDTTSGQKNPDRPPTVENLTHHSERHFISNIPPTPAKRLEKPGEKKKRKREREKEGKRALKRQGLVVLGSGEENPRVLLGDADQESEARMSKNALRTGRRQAVE